MSTKGKSAINGRTLDITHLVREIQADVATYQQYKAEDVMKKRAIHTSKSNEKYLSPYFLTMIAEFEN